MHIRPITLIVMVLALAGMPAWADEAEIHTFHCLNGCPVGAPATNDLIVREIYSLSSNDTTKFADWVAYRVTTATIGSGESRVWRPDPWLSDEETLEPPDYDGAPAALKIDRGHQAPLASFAGTPQAAETNYLSNITPQRSDLNQAPWMYLETRERDLAKRDRIAVYVLTGPLYERSMQPMPNAEAHVVPSGYWKIVMTEKGELTAFIFDQDTPRSAKYCDQRAALDAVEARSHLQLFPRLKVRAFKPLDARLGC